MAWSSPKKPSREQSSCWEGSGHRRQASSQLCGGTGAAPGELGAVLPAELSRGQHTPSPAARNSSRHQEQGCSPAPTFSEAPRPLPALSVSAPQPPARSRPGMYCWQKAAALQGGFEAKALPRLRRINSETLPHLQNCHTSRGGKKKKKVGKAGEVKSTAARKQDPKQHTVRAGLPQTPLRCFNSPYPPCSCIQTD